MQKQKTGRFFRQFAVSVIACVLFAMPTFAAPSAGAIAGNATNAIPAAKPTVKLSGIESKPQRLSVTIDAAFCKAPGSWPKATAGMADPSQLVSIRGIPGVTVQGGDSGNGMLRPEARAALAAAAQVAQQNGYSLEVTSTYRSLERQIQLYCQNKVLGKGPDTAYPGGSNHGNGVAMDVKLMNGGTALTTAGSNGGTTKENEATLNGIMTSAGFGRYCPEIWHFEYGTGTSATVRQDCVGKPTTPTVPPAEVEKAPQSAAPIPEAPPTPTATKPGFTVPLHAAFAKVPEMSGCPLGSKSCTSADGSVTCAPAAGTGILTCSLDASKPQSVFTACGTSGYGSDVCVDAKGNYFRFYPTSSQFRQLVVGTDGSTMLQHYSSLIYRFLAGAIGIIAVLMVVIGGIQIGTSGLNSGGVEEGKNKIISALAGIALLFLSSLILYTINPNFFSL